MEAPLTFTVLVLTSQPAKVLVHWDWLPGFLRQNYSLKIFSSLDPQNFKEITGFFDGTEYNEYIDYTKDITNFQKQVYYQIEVKKKDTNESILIGAQTWRGNPDLESIYVVEEHEFLYQDYIGVPTFIMIRKSEGANCKECWDPISKMRKKSHCLSCYGTNFQGGFYRPMLRWIDFSPDPKMTVLEQWGERQPTEVDIRLTNNPRIRQGDLIVDAISNRRYRVKRAFEAERRRYPLLQMARVELIPVNDIEHQVPINENDIFMAAQELERIKQLRDF